MSSNNKDTVLPIAFLTMFLLKAVAGDFPVAQKVTWSSINFKTLLVWGPEPENYSYTVEYSALGKDRQRTPNCIRSSNTECDLTQQLTDLKATYTADIVSEPVRGETSDIVEFPYTRSAKFSPYTDTLIGKPDFVFSVDEDGRKITINVTDPLTAIIQHGRHLNIREIFGADLEYRARYRRAGSTGKKYQVSKTNVIEVERLDKGQSYCIMVQAVIPSRGLDRQYGEFSNTKCTPNKGGGILDEYSFGTIAGGILTILAVVVAIIVGTVFGCKRRQKGKPEKDGGVV